jgi:hypothetical protein
MQMDEGNARLLDPVTERIIGCVFRVANTLGHGFVEKVYENALALKVVAALSDMDLPQCRNYLRTTGKPLCLLINFGRPKVEIRRITAQA